MYEPLPVITGFVAYIISLSGFVYDDDDARQRLLNVDCLLRLFVGCYTKERKLGRKYYIKTLNLINRLQALLGHAFVRMTVRICLFIDTLIRYIAGDILYLLFQP